MAIFTAYVSPTGSDGAGFGTTPEAPWKTLKYACWNTKGTEGTIWLASGSYYELGINGRYIGTKDLTIASSSGLCTDTVIFPIDLVYPGNNYASCWFGNTTSTARTWAFYNLSFILDLNNINGTYKTAKWQVNDIIYCDGTLKTIGCYFEGRNLDNGSVGASANVAALQAIGDTPGYFYKNTFRNFTLNGSHGIAISGVMINADPNRFIAVDNIIGSCDVGIQTRYGTGDLTESYNCFNGNGRDYIYGNSGYPADPSATTGTLSATDITADPAFLGTGSPIITAASPCIDSGTPVSGYVGTWVGAAPDIGAFEWIETERQLLIFTGPYNDGTGYGTVNLTPYVLEVGDVHESLMNGAETRGWVMQTTVQLDDADQFWSGSFALGNDWLQGTFTLQQTFGGTWTPMLVGYVEPGGYTHNYGDRLVNLQITSVLARKAYQLVPYGTIERGTYDPYRPLVRLMGTVSAVGTDGTVTLNPAENVFVMLPHHSFLWQGVGGTVYPNTQAQSRLRGFDPEYFDAYSGSVRSLTFESGVPDWCTVGQSIYITEPWPTQAMLDNEVSVQAQYSGIGSYDLPHPLCALWYDACRQMGLTFDSDSLNEFGTRIAFYQMSVMSQNQAASGVYSNFPWSNGTSAYYYGGEKWTDVLTDLFTSVGANWTVNGAGSLRAYLYQPGETDPSGSLSFLDAHGNEWQYALQEGASEVKVYSDYDPADGYQGTFVLKTGASGNAVSLNARWQRSTGGPLLASRMRFKLGSTGPKFSLTLDGTLWPNYQVGQTWSITDMPAELLPVTGSNLVIASKTYSYMNNTTTLNFITGAETTGIFRTGTIGTAPEPSELDGTDILW